MIRVREPMVRHRLTWIAVLICMTTALASGAAKSRPSAREPFWQASWPVPAPLQVEILSCVTKANVDLYRLRYTGSVWRGRPQRVFAILGLPRQTASPPRPLPGILHIHGGGQTASEENVIWFAARGYACLSFDWSGPAKQRQEDEVTSWSLPLRGALLTAVDQDPENCLLYHATLAARRGLDLLAARPEVDAKRLGVVGISWGGLITWIVNSLDERVRVAVPIYGNGSCDSQWNVVRVMLNSQPEAWRAKWMNRFDPQGFTRTQRSPVLYLGASNDFFGSIDISEARMKELAVDHRRSYGRNRMHSLDRGSAGAALAWLEHTLKQGPPVPAEPALALTRDPSGQVLATVRCDPAAKAKRVAIAFTSDTSPFLIRYWQTAPAAFDPDGLWRSYLPIAPTDKSLCAYAMVDFAGDLSLSSAMQKIDFASRELASPPPDRDSGRGLEWGAAPGAWYVHYGTELYDAWQHDQELVTQKMDGKPAIGFDRSPPSGRLMLATRWLASHAATRGKHQRLSLWLHDFPKVSVRLNWMVNAPGMGTYEAQYAPGSGWQELTLDLKDFRLIDREGGGEKPPPASPAAWSEVVQLHLICETASGLKPALGRMAWVEETGPQ